MAKGTSTPGVAVFLAQRQDRELISGQDFPAGRNTGAAPDGVEVYLRRATGAGSNRTAFAIDAFDSAHRDINQVHVRVGDVGVGIVATRFDIAQIVFPGVRTGELERADALGGLVAVG